MPEKIEKSSVRVFFFLALEGTFLWLFSILSLKRGLIGTLRGDRCEAKNLPTLPTNLHPSSLKEHEITAKKIVFLTRWMQALQLWTQIPQYSWFLSNDRCWEVPSDTFGQLYFVWESRYMIPFHQILELILCGSTIKHCGIDCYSIILFIYYQVFEGHIFVDPFCIALVHAAFAKLVSWPAPCGFLDGQSPQRRLLKFVDAARNQETHSRSAIMLSTLHRFAVA